MTTGASLCLTMIFMIFTMQAADVTRLIYDLLIRWWDRGLSCNWKLPNPKFTQEDVEAGASKTHNEKEQYIPRTKKLRQKDLNALYTGAQIEAGEKFALTFTALTIFIGYSLGLPVLFPLAVVFFFCQYWFSKILLMRYYEKTYEFNEELPIHSTSFGYLGIFLNIVFSILKLSNNRMLPMEVSKSKSFDYPTEIPESNFLAPFMQLHVQIYLLFLILVLITFLMDTFGWINLKKKTYTCTYCLWRCITFQRLRAKKHVSKEEKVKPGKENGKSFHEDGIKYIDKGNSSSEPDEPFKKGEETVDAENEVQV